MEFNQLITLDRIRCDANVSSKKRSIEYLSELLAANEEDLDAVDIFTRLTERERLGSTGLGHGVALPHSRLANDNFTRGAFIKLNRGINFDSVDDQSTDLLFALIVPEQHTDEHLEILAQLARMFSDKAFCTKLRNSNSDEALYQCLINWQLDSKAS